MGLNVDLCQMLGVPKKVICPHCKKQVKTHFNDCDIEMPRINPKPGVWDLHCYCEDCDKDWKYSVKINLEQIV